MSNVKLIGFDIGGTKCAAVVGCSDKDGNIRITSRTEVKTAAFASPYDTINALCDSVKDEATDAAAIGISCGGPLDSRRGTINSPPNLPGWDNVEIVALVKNRFGIPVCLQNDANACALAEWKFGAGKGCRNMVFFTCGTGFGAGLILDGRLYSGTNDNAGEIGHVRLAQFGPVGYGKSGSAEGFCSGGGIARLGQTLALERFQKGLDVPFCKGRDLSTVSAKSIAEAAKKGDKTALRVYEISARKLGEVCALTVDILNPEVIVIGSVFARSEDLMRKTVEEVVKAEALPFSSSVCRIVPALLGDSIGDYASLAAAKDLYDTLHAGEASH